MWNKNDITFFRRVLLEWFTKNGRDFQWRSESISNYQLIFSEILLQRTKAETVSKYFQTFFSKYPGWNELASATIEDLEEILRPLGLYKHRALRIYRIVEEYTKRNGILPANKEELQESSLSTLYIAHAYELFVLKHRAALLDVNMSRLLTRFFYPKEFKDVRNDKLVQDLADNVINVKKCKELNWAILDFAALVCKAKGPKCLDCQLRHKCRFFSLSIKESNSNTEEPQLNIKYDSETYMNPDKPLKVVSLFSGCGGMDLGFEGDFIVHKSSVNENLCPDDIHEHIDENYVKLKATKFQTVFANDILQEARDVWVNYFKNKQYSSEIYHVDSIVDLVKLHYQGEDIFPKNVDVVTGGFPCQDFSLAGKRNGFNSHKDHKGSIIKTEVPSIETRGQLYMWLKEVIEITKPNIFIAENVKGLVNLANVKEIIQKDFSNADGNGYLVLDPLVLHAANYGVPQSRERVIFIGVKKAALNPEALRELKKSKISDKFNPYPKPTHSFSANGSHLKKPVPLSLIFGNLSEPEFSVDPSQKFYSKAKFMGKHCQGQTEVNLAGLGPTIRSEHHGNIEFRRLSLQHGGKYKDELTVKNLKERRLTPRECALIQTFPPDYEFVIPSSGSRFFISPSTAYKLIGNAVPPLLAYHIARRIEKLWDVYFNINVNGSINKSRTNRKSISTPA